jgi:threonine dehydrogenase-like Zn-dependent dehydrogenase
LNLAASLGATDTVNAMESDLEDAIVRLTERPSVVVECSGQPKPIQQAIRVAGVQARVALAG